MNHRRSRGHNEPHFEPPEVEPVPIFTPPGWTLVQYCPCGHLGNVKTERVQRQVDDPKRMGAPHLHSNECPECEEGTQRQDRLNWLMDL